MHFVIHNTNIGFLQIRSIAAFGFYAGRFSGHHFILLDTRTNVLILASNVRRFMENYRKSQILFITNSWCENLQKICKKKNYLI